MKKTILTIDDDISIRNLLHYLLRKQYEVITKEDGLAGMLWLDQGNMPDLILADVNTPKLSGFDFVANVKKSGFFRDIPVIMLSSADHSEETIKCIQSGADDFLMKPFNPDELFAKVERVLNHSNSYSYEKLKN